MSTHTPIIEHQDGANYRVSCANPDCSFVAYAGTRDDATYLNIFKDHADQYSPGRVPDITVEFVISADCSVCEDGGDIDTNDSETVVCKQCGATWYIDGSGGTA